MNEEDIDLVIQVIISKDGDIAIGTNRKVDPVIKMGYLELAKIQFHAEHAHVVQENMKKRTGGLVLAR